MIFNSNGKTHLNSFKLNKDILETVKTYCYLGLTIKYTGNFNISSHILMEKGRKAWFKIKNSIRLDNPCSMLEKLFYTLISPIILYGCEIWGPSSNFKNSDPYEHLHLKFIKEILGVHSKAMNSACLTELNRQPLKVKIITQVIKFWEHIAHSNNTLVNEIYNNIPHNNKWLTTVHNWMKELGFNYLISDTHLHNI